MPDCAACSLFQVESEQGDCLHVNRPGGLALTDELLQLASLPAQAAILDIACGTGTTLHHLCQHWNLNAVGLDLSAGMLSLAILRHARLTCLRADAAGLPLASTCFQAVLVECALTLSGKMEQVLAECRRVLVPGGKLLLSDMYIRTPEELTSLAHYQFTGCLSGATNRGTIQKEIESAGFELLTWEDRTACLKQWLAGMVLKLGSLNAVYRQLTGNGCDSGCLEPLFGKEVKLGYYLLVAAKSAG